MKDFMLKHPIITLFMLSDLCVLVNNIVCYIATDRKGDRGFTVTAIKDTAKAVRDKIENDKEAKVEIGFHK